MYSREVACNLWPTKAQKEVLVGPEAYAQGLESEWVYSLVS